jgi:hypothetical protein
MTCEGAPGTDQRALGHALSRQAPSRRSADRPDWKPDPQGTWLVIRYEPLDLGARPVPNGDIYWESPDIRVVGGDALGNPVGGQPTTVEALVSNFGGLDASPVRVDFAFIAPSLGIVRDSPQHIGTTWTTVLAGHTTLVQCPVPWTPPTYETNLHACLLVTCSAPAQHDTPTAPTSPVLDRHVGQRNLTIIELSPGQILPIAVRIGNPFARDAEVHLVGSAQWQSELDRSASMRVGRLGVAAAIRAAQTSTKPSAMRLWLRRASLADLATRAAQADAPYEDARQLVAVGDIRRARTKPPRTALTLPDPLVPHVDFDVLTDGTFLEPGQVATVALEVRLPESPKAPWLQLGLAQAQGGLITGGYTVLVKVRE